MQLGGRKRGGLGESVDERELNIGRERKEDGEECGFGGNVEFVGNINEPIEKFHSIL